MRLIRRPHALLAIVALAVVAAAPDAGGALPSHSPVPAPAPMRTLYRPVGCVLRGPAHAYTSGPHRKVVALSFDDGPAPDTAAFVRMLQAQGVPATFFMIGEQVTAQYRATLRSELRAGDALGDHTYTHPDLLRLSGRGVYSELSRTLQAIRALTGYSPCVFRPPYGDYDQSVVDTARALGLATILWNVDPSDWALPGVRAIEQRVLAQVRPGSIVISHDGGGPRGQTLAAYPYIIGALRKRGYSFLTVPQLLGFRTVYEPCTGTCAGVGVAPPLPPGSIVRREAPRTRAQSDAQAQGARSPRVLGECALAAPPQIAFPGDSPTHATGPGAIAWLTQPTLCQPATGGRSTDDRATQRPLLTVAWLGSGGRITAIHSQPIASDAGATPTLSAQGASFGRVAVALADGERTRLVLQGRRVHPLTPALTFTQGAGPLGLTRAYLDDVAVASVQRSQAAGGAQLANGGRLANSARSANSAQSANGTQSIAVSIERHYSNSFAAPLHVPIAAGRVTALAVTMDYRSDTLLAWQQDGAIYAHLLRASGQPEPTQRLGSSTPNPQLQALVSDNDRAIVVWSSTAPRSGSQPPRTTVYLARSATHVRFHAPRIIAAFADPAEVGHRSGSLALVRLADESVMLAWTTRLHGHYTVLAAPAVFNTALPARPLTPPTAQAVLSALAPGAGSQAVALWQGAAGSASPGQLWAARLYLTSQGRIGATASTAITPAGSAAVVDPTVAVDPASDRALVAWLQPGPHGGEAVYAAAI
jgi:peptidoglycan-N-acetylglucosamine deacetylase